MSDMQKIQKANAFLISTINKRKILQLIRNEEEISRADIVKKTGLSAPTVTRIVENLILEEHLVSMVGRGDSTGGRPPLIVKFNGENNYVIGIDIGATNIRGVLSNLNAEFLTEIQVSTRIEEGYEKVMDQVGEIIEKLMVRKKIDNSRILGVGVAVGGLINRTKNIIEYSPDFHWHDVDISKSLKKYINCPIDFVNVSRSMALGELWYGVGKKYKHFICINVGYGIGSGIIINGKPLYGIDGMAGEFGHITVEKDSKVQCQCRNFGCLEALASGSGIAIATQNILKKGNKSILYKMCNNEIENVTAKMVFEASGNGDEIAHQIVEQSLEYLGQGIGSLVNIFNPEAIFIGGGVAANGKSFFDPLEKYINKHIISQVNRKVNILPATFGENSALMGAFSAILFKVLNLDFSKSELVN